MAEDKNKGKDIINDVYKKFTTAMAGLERISTGSIMFDTLLGGGLPVGVSIAISSEQGTGKSTLLLHACKSYCKLGHKVVYLDYEKGVTIELLETMGLASYLYDPDGILTGTPKPDGTFMLYQVDTFDEGEEILDSLIFTGDIRLVVIDSTNMMQPGYYLTDNKKEKVSVSASRPGASAQIMGNWVPKYVALGRKFRTTFVYVEQYRTKISFVNTTSGASGGYAIKHGVHCQIMMKRRSYLDKNIETLNGTEKVHIGSEVEVFCEKSRFCNSFVSVFMTILFGKGVSNIQTYNKWLSGQTIEKDGKSLKMLSMAGAGFYTMNLPSGEYKARGENGVYALIKEHIDEIKTYIDDHGGFKLIVKDGSDE